MIFFFESPCILLFIYIVFIQVDLVDWACAEIDLQAESKTPAAGGHGITIRWIILIYGIRNMQTFFLD